VFLSTKTKKVKKQAECKEIMLVFFSAYFVAQVHMFLAFSSIPSSAVRAKLTLLFTYLLCVFLTYLFIKNETVVSVLIAQQYTGLKTTLITISIFTIIFLSSMYLTIIN